MTMVRTKTMAAFALGLAMTAAGIGFGRAQMSATPQYDVLIRGGHIMDGTGNPWYAGDVAIKGGRIARIGAMPDATAARVIDASGLIVAPGFIDLHTHSDISLVDDGTAQSKIRQGVTLEVLGEGSSVAPRDGLTASPREEAEEGGVKQDWTTFTDYYNRLKRQGISMNISSSVAYSQVRRVVMGYATRPATPDELERMKQLVARSMDEGAMGLVTIFEAQTWYPDEVLALAKVAAAHGGFYASHIGSEGYRQDAEMDFAFRVAREAHIPVEIFHFKARGTENWPKMQHFIDRINAARAEGLDITANQYPYTAMNHPWILFFPLWAIAGGPAEFAKRLQDPAIRAKILADKDFKEWSQEHGGWDGIVYARAVFPGHKKYEGMTIRQIAALRGDTDPGKTAIDLQAESGGTASGIYHNMSEDNVRLVLKQPWVAIASDAGAINLTAPGFPHPRAFGSNARVLGYYARDQKVLTLEDAVRKMTSLPAQILKLPDRGQLQKGFAADVVIFDPKTVIDTATFEKPKSYATGIPYVLVNGTLVIDKGQHTGARPGVPVYGPGVKAATITASR